MKPAQLLKTSLALLSALALTACVGFVVVPVPLPADPDSAPERGVRDMRDTRN
jgi:hypothetical protein